MEEDIKTIYVNLYEDITSIIDRLELIEETIIILFIPFDSYLAQNITNFKILKREEAHLDKYIIIVSPDIVVREFARSVGFEVFEEIEDVYEHFKTGGLKRKITTKVFDIIKPSYEKEIEYKEENREELPKKNEAAYKEKIFQERPIKEVEDIKLKSKPEGYLKEEIKPSRVELDFLQKPSRGEKKELFGEDKVPLSYGIKKESIVKKLFSAISRLSFLEKSLFAVVIFSLIVGFISFYFLLEEASIKIYPVKEVNVFDLKIKANKNISKINFEKMEIPAQVVAVEKNTTEEFFATGKKFAKTKAKGTITVYNVYSSWPQKLVKNTRFLSQDKKLFRTTKAIIIPGAKIKNGQIVPSSIDVEVVADQIGPEYNIPPSTFTIPGFKGGPKYKGFYGKSFDYMKGGANGDVVYITEDDVKKAKKTVLDKLFNVAQSELESQIPENLKLIPEAKENKTISINVEPKENEIAKKFKVTAKIVSYAFLFDEKDLSDLIHYIALSRTKKGEIADKNTQKIEFKSSSIDFSRGEAIFNIRAEETAYASINKDDLKSKLAGKNYEAINEFFGNQKNIEKADVTLWPFWISKVPKSLNKIKIEIVK